MLQPLSSPETRVASCHRASAVLLPAVVPLHFHPLVSRLLASPLVFVAAPVLLPHVQPAFIQLATRGLGPQVLRIAEIAAPIATISLSAPRASSDPGKPAATCSSVPRFSVPLCSPLHQPRSLKLCCSGGKETETHILLFNKGSSRRWKQIDSLSAVCACCRWGCLRRSNSCAREESRPPHPHLSPAALAAL